MQSNQVKNFIAKHGPTTLNDIKGNFVNFTWKYKLYYIFLRCKR